MEQVVYSPDLKKTLPILHFTSDGEALLMVDARMLHRALMIGVLFAVWMNTCIRRKLLKQADCKLIGAVGNTIGGARPRVLVAVDVAARIVLRENRPHSSEIRIYLLSQKGTARGGDAGPQAGLR